MRTSISTSILAVALAALCLPASAQQSAAKKSAPAHSHGKTQKAHDHGAAQIDIAVEGKTIDVELHVPAMGVVGFEHIATSADDRKKQADALAKLKADIAKIVVFDAAAKCIVSIAKTEIEQEEPDHAEVDGDFTFTCAQSPAGTTVRFGLTKAYPAITSAKVQVVATGGSTGAQIKADQGTVVIPK